MCGRYSLTLPIAEVEKRFGVKAPEPIAPLFNIAPSQTMPIITGAESGLLTFARWGLIPERTKDPAGVKFTHNARSETVETTFSFSGPFKRRRCLVPADRFYEWHKPDGQKKGTPYRISLPDGKPFAFAGLWDMWNGGGAPLLSFTIITREANEQMAWLHNRMPLILSPEQEKLWLSESTDLAEVRDLAHHVPDMELAFTASDPRAEMPLGGLFS